jgi:hypothetical protein
MITANENAYYDSNHTKEAAGKRLSCSRGTGVVKRR